MRSIFVLLILVMIGLNGKGQSVTALPDSVLSQCCLEVTLLNGNVTTVDWVFIQYITRDGTGTKLFVEYAPNFGGIQWETQIRIQDDFDNVLERSKFIVIPFTVGSTDYGINRNWIANIEENTTTGGTWIYGRFGTPTKRKFSAVEDYETMKNLLLACRPRAIVVAENGLYTEGDTVRMGGFLIEPTRVQLEGYPITFIDTVAKQSFGIGEGNVSGYFGDTLGYFGRRSGAFRQFILQGNRYNQIVIRDTSSAFGDYVDFYQGLYFGGKPFMYLHATDNEFDGKFSRISVDSDSVHFRNSPYLSSIDAYSRFFTAKAGRISIGAIEGELGITGTGVQMGAYGYGIGGGATEYLFMKTKAVDAGTATNGQYLQLIDNSSGEVDFATIDLSAYLPIADTAAMLDPYIQGAGTLNYLPKFTAGRVIGNSNLFDNNTYAGVIGKPWKFGEYTTAGLPTGVTGYTVYNTTTNGPAWYQGSRWAYGLESTFNRGTATRVPYFDANGQVTENSSFTYTSATNTLLTGTVTSITRGTGSPYNTNTSIISNTVDGDLVLSQSSAAGYVRGIRIQAAKSITLETGTPPRSFSVTTIGLDASATSGIKINGNMAFGSRSLTGGSPVGGLTFGTMSASDFLITGTDNNLSSTANAANVQVKGGDSGSGYAGPSNGGNVFIYGGNSNSGGRFGNTILGWDGTAQRGGVGIGIAIPNPVSILDISSTTKGVLFPRMTTVQRDDINVSNTIGDFTSVGFAGGSGYVNGTYFNVPLTGGSGTGATVNITVSGGTIALLNVIIVNVGSGYVAGDNLSASNTNLGGSGSGFNIRVGTVFTARGMFIFNTTSGAIEYYDGSTWKSFLTEGFYQQDGSLVSSRTVTGGSFWLNLNSNVGIKQATPLQELDVNGDLRVRDSIDLDITPAHSAITGLLTRDATGWVGLSTFGADLKYSAGVLGLKRKTLIDSLPISDVTINGASSSDFRIQNTRVQFDGKFKIGSDSSFVHDPAQDTTFFKGNIKQNGNLFTQSGTNAGRNFPNVLLFKSDAAYSVAGTSYRNPGTGQFNWYVLNDQRNFGEDGFGIKNENLQSAFGPTSYTTLFTIRNNGNLELGYSYLSRYTRVNSDTFLVSPTYSTSPEIIINDAPFYAIGHPAYKKVVVQSKFYIGTDSTLKFDPVTDLLQLSAYGTSATTAPSQGKTESGYIASFADDGTVMSREIKRDTTIYVVDADYDFSAAITTAQIASRYNRVVFLMTTTAAAGSDSELTLHTPDINLMQCEYLVRSTDEAGGFSNVIRFGTNNAVDSTNGLASSYFPAAGQGVGIRAGLRSGAYKYFYY